MARVRNASCFSVFLCGDEAVKRGLETLVAEWKERCSLSVSRREEMKEVDFEIVDDPKKATVAMGFPAELLDGLKGKRKSTLSVIVVLKDSSWDGSVEKLHGDIHSSVVGIFRQSHLGLSDQQDRDLDELARLQSTLTSLFRAELRKKAGEETLYKSVAWKAKIAKGSGPSFFSLCADPSTQELMDDLKSGLRSVTDEKDLRSLRLYREEVKKFVKRDGQKIEIIANYLGEKCSDFPRVPSILLLGETGTGKSLLARWIAEALFPGQDDGFASMNISAVPSDLVDTMLFGAVEGAYSGMKEGEDALGFFLTHVGKVVFLDEIGDMRSDHQTRLLTYMDGGTITPVGYHRPISVPVILVAATNRPLKEWVSSGYDGFRADLLHRFDHVVEVPPIRERQGDRKLLLSLTLQDEDVNRDERVSKISLDAIKYLVEKEYPGNFRELRFTVRRAVQKAIKEGSDMLCLRHCL